MKHQWICKHTEGARRVLLFFNGWGQDSRAIARLSCPQDTDVVMFYAYHSEGDFDFSSLAGYPQREVAAWSMGVWYASRLKALQDVQPTRTVALCGTPWPIDDRYGIPCAVFDATLAGLSPRSVEKFAMRMEGGVAAYRQSPLSQPGSRSFEDVRSELEWWHRQCLSQGEAPLTLGWQKALVGLSDAIFPPENQLRAWQRAGVQPCSQAQLPHDPFSSFGSWDQVFDF